MKFRIWLETIDTPKQALEILGLGNNPSNDEINKAWKKLSQINHPDVGGSQQ